jgi:hypothetical protein
VGLVAISAVLTRNFLCTKDTQQRRRIKWVIAGTLVATVALMAVEMASLALSRWYTRTRSSRSASPKTAVFSAKSRRASKSGNVIETFFDPGCIV